jgi:hypothetical protein
MASSKGLRRARSPWYAAQLSRPRPVPTLERARPEAAEEVGGGGEPSLDWGDETSVIGGVPGPWV